MTLPPVLADSSRDAPEARIDGANAERRAGGGRRSEFDVCHAGVVLRTVLFVHGAVAVGLLPGAEDWLGWLSAVSLAFAVVLPATLLWLLAACLGQPWLVRLPRAGRWAAALGMGAGCGALVGAGLSAWRDGVVPVVAGASTLASLGAVVVGAALAGCVFHWLEQRVRMLTSPGTAARLAELQSRIRPHFLFNALNSAIALVAVRPEQAERVLEDLSALFRAALDETRDQVSLASELTLAQHYLAIEQVRFGERLRVVWQIDPAVTHALVPPLVLQPLVENAVKHGVEAGAVPADVTVAVSVLDRHRLVVQIRNCTAQTGAGPVPEVRRPGLGMALANVRERLHLMHDVSLQFDAGPAEPGWWQVRIVLPRGGRS